MSDLVVDALGRFHFGKKTFHCALGRSGRLFDHHEGDGATPIGRFALRRVLYRPDRIARPKTALPVEAILPDDLWCDDPASPDYNRPVRRPFAASHEEMWRSDGLYDLVVILGHNDDPPVPGLGSAIFLHVASPDYRPTQGCVALTLEDLTLAVEGSAPGDCLVIEET